MTPQLQTLGRMMLRALTRAGRWGLPMFGVLAISASISYGITTAVAGAEFLREDRESVTTVIAGPVSSYACDTAPARMLLDAISNGWVSSPVGEYCHRA